MSNFVPGQRWVVDAEPELGLGIVMDVDARAVSLTFPQAQCERLYAVEKAPLTRIIFEVGDEVHLLDDRRLTVLEVHQHNGLVVYDVGEEKLVPEPALSSEIHMNQPFLRLMTGQLDKPKWFAFRRQFDSAMADVWHSRLAGLLGVRANLIAHQCYVAWAACQRTRVRVLLADEVGLGKTLEAGMILKRLMQFGRSEKALIVVPDALQVQWLVELVRRFNLHPQLYSGLDTDFTQGDLHLVPTSFLHSDDASALASADFDTVVVDEAHHLAPGDPAFSLLSHLAETSAHLILLSATPEQLGFEGHFARLRLLDPLKFVDEKAYLEQEKHYLALSRQIEALPDTRETLVRDYGIRADASDEAVIQHLLDCHGLGRVMYRNTRAAVSGFPRRNAVFHQLADDEWVSKFEWLAEWAKQDPDRKVLVICQELEQVKACEAHLWQKHGMDAALFHEQMDLIERDRAAAYFADEERGSQILLCSEIGSEGRNFQFCQHLVCLDLPDHPDLLEQRIGRLDRIGQGDEVAIHIPYGEGSETEKRLNWYHQVLRCIDRQSPAAAAVHEEFWPLLAHDNGDDSLRKQALALRERLETEIHQGRDALLELNSCRQPAADELVDGIAAFDRSSPYAIVEQASDLLNFHFEETRAKTYSLIPADNMLIPSLPGIPAEGVEVTFDRMTANNREDLLFLSWDSPFVVGLWELLHHSDLGSASVALLPSRQLPAGQCMLEACFDLVVQAADAKSCRPFLEQMSIRTLALDISDKDMAEKLPETSLEQSLRTVDRKFARKIIQSQKANLQGWYHKVEEFAALKKAQYQEQARANAREYYANEIARMESLIRQNPQVDGEDVEQVKAQASSVDSSLAEHLTLQLSAVRLIVTAES